MYIIYGIPNCDTMKKAITWLNAHKVPFEFHDYKKLGITGNKLKEWSKQVGWETLLNRKGTTWRELDPATQALITNEKAAIKLLSENTSAIKRPVLEKDGKVVAVGFDIATYDLRLLQKLA